jgi:formylglycine-generating enzyme required for sulfatase activity
LPRRAWVGAVLGSALTVAGFAVGVWLAHDPHVAGHVSAAGGDWKATPPGTCPAGLALVVGGQLPGVAEDVKEHESEPARPSQARSFCMGQDEVTVGEYTACVAAGACEPAQRDGGVRPAQLASASRKSAAAEPPQCNFGQAGRDLYPINCVSFQQAQQYCAWRGGRLPTESEWESVAERSSSDPGEQHPGTIQVGSYPGAVTPEGILDLLGNVSEWTSGHVDFYERGADGSEGVHRELYAVLGGSLEPGASRIGSQVSRMYTNAGARGRNVGFRCAFDD